MHHVIHFEKSKKIQHHSLPYSSTIRPIVIDSQDIFSSTKKDLIQWRNQNRAKCDPNGYFFRKVAKFTHYTPSCTLCSARHLNKSIFKLKDFYFGFKPPPSLLTKPWLRACSNCYRNVQGLFCCSTAVRANVSTSNTS